MSLAGSRYENQIQTVQSVIAYRSGGFRLGRLSIFEPELLVQQFAVHAVIIEFQLKQQ